MCCTHTIISCQRQRANISTIKHCIYWYYYATLSIHRPVLLNDMPIRRKHMSKRVVKPSDDYLSVNEFATRIDKSTQSIYKRIRENPDFIKYVVVVNGHKLVHKSALQEVYGIEPDPEVIEDDVQPDENPNQELINLLKQQLQEKDKHIAELTQALIYEQKLHANTSARLAMLEDRQRAEGVDQEEPEPEEQKEDTRKVSGYDVEQVKSPQIRLKSEKAEDLPKGVFGRLKRLIRTVKR